MEMKKRILKAMAKLNWDIKELDDIVNAFEPTERSQIAAEIKKMEDDNELAFENDRWVVKNLNTEEEDKDKQKKPQSSFIESNGQIYEQVYNPQDDTSRFVTWDRNNGIQFFDEVNETVPIQFISKEETQAILLPVKPRNFKGVQSLIKEIQEHIMRYSDVSEEFRVFSSYYVLLSWVFDKINTLPYLRVLGDTSTGKSRFLDTVGRLLYKATIISGCVTPAPIYRLLRRWGGSIIVDEADRKQSDTTDEVIKILCCGFERNRPVIRCTKDDPNKMEFLPTFGPKVIATRRTFYDKALESRCLTEIMKETSRKDIPRLLPQEFYEEEEVIREKLLMFRLRYRDKIDVSKVQGLDLGDIESRLQQATLSFAVLFSNLPEILNKFKEFLYKYNKELVEERSNSPDGMIINAIFELRSKSENISAADIVDKLGNDKLTPQKIGGSLKSLGIKTQKKRIGDETKRCIIWDENLMEQLKKKYIPSEDVPSVASVPIPLDTPSLGTEPKDKEEVNIPKPIYDTLGTNGTLGTDKEKYRKHLPESEIFKQKLNKCKTFLIQHSKEFTKKQFLKAVNLGRDESAIMSFLKQLKQWKINSDGKICFTGKPTSDVRVESEEEIKNWKRM